MNQQVFIKVLILVCFLVPNLAWAKSYTEIWPVDQLDCANNVLNSLLDQKDYDRAKVHARSCQDPVLLDFIKLQKVLKSQASELNYFEVEELYSSYQDYPGYISLKLQLVRSIKDPIELQHAYQKYAKEWRKDKSVYNIIAHFFLRQEMSEFYLDDFQYILQNVWLHSSLSKSQTIKLYHKYKTNISSLEVKQKISLLLWQGQTYTAKSLLKYVDEDYKQYYDIRAAFRDDSRNALSGLKAIPKEYHFDDGLFYDIVWWFQRRNLDGKIPKYLLALPSRLSNPEVWYKIRILNARYLLDEDRSEEAYTILLNHQVSPGSIEYAELEWLSGWIALEYLDKPNVALKHFKRLSENVSFPISISRARYWLGRTYAAMNNNLMADGWFEKAAKYSTTFYGQMALMELQEDFSIKLPELVLPNTQQMKNILTDDKVARLGLYLKYSGYKSTARTYLKRSIKNNQSRESAYNVIALAEYSEDYILANYLAKYATRFNIFTSSNYPVIDDIKIEDKEKSLLHALIKQESGFNAQAVSSAGAIGFMQIMPQTAKEVARKLKVKYSKKRLSHDPEYNIKLGAYYINYLMKKFDGSYILAVASYNAGPTSSRRWIKNNGDPRVFTNIHQVINWVERIPYPETRNYVQRILENAVIYMHIFQD